MIKHEHYLGQNARGYHIIQFEKDGETCVATVTFVPYKNFKIIDVISLKQTFTNSKFTTMLSDFEINELEYFILRQLIGTQLDQQKEVS